MGGSRNAKQVVYAYRLLTFHIAYLLVIFIGIPLEYDQKMCDWPTQIW